VSARISRVPAIVNSVTGLPYIIVSNKRSLSGKLARLLAMRWYTWSLTGSKIHCVLQNEDDLRELRAFSGIELKNVTLTRGSGVDLDHYGMCEPANNETPTLLFVGRMLREKGIFELIDAVRLLKARKYKFQFIVCGDIDSGNRSSATENQCQRWINEGLVSSRQQVDDVRPFLKIADIVVLPSYREGTPRSLLEAMAMGRPIVATDVPGCREVVDDGVNGLLVAPKHVESLAEAIAMLLDNPDRRRGMGLASRAKVTSEFNERDVIQANFDVYQSLLPNELGRLLTACRTDKINNRLDPQAARQVSSS